jgi:hypothetical protein
MAGRGRPRTREPASLRTKLFAVNRQILRAVLLATVPIAVFARGTALATDEVQVYNAEIAEVGQWTFQQHLNYVLQGRTQPEFPDGLVPNHSLNGTPELAYGLTEWWELGWYAPFAVDSRGQLLSDGAKIRTLFVTPHASQRSFFYGMNFEFSYSTPKFSQTRFGIEVRPIVGIRHSEWELIVNPIVDIGLGDLGQADFAPAARLARKLGEEFSVGLEYYSELGEIGHFLPLREQQHTLFAVTDFKLGKLDINLGIGCGLTSGSDRLVAKTIIGYAFPVPGKKDPADERMPNRPPTASSAMHTFVGSAFAPGLFAAR